MAPDDTFKSSRRPVNYREFQRGEVSITASIREHGGGRQQVEVIDLSRAGFRMRTAAFIPHDRVLFVTLPGFSPLEARIAWRKREHYGCAFVQSLHEAIYDHIIRTYPSLKE